MAIESSLSADLWLQRQPTDFHYAAGPCTSLPTYLPSNQKIIAKGVKMGTQITTAEITRQAQTAD